MIKMKKIIRRFKYNFLFALLFAAAAILPDYVLQFSSVHFRIGFDAVFVFALTLFGFFLSLSGRVIFCAVTVFLFVCQIIQLNYMAYSGRPISPVDIHKIFVEFPDIWSSGMGAIKDVWFVTPMLFLTFGGTAYFFFKYRKQFGFSVLAALIVIGTMAQKPERASRKSLKHFLPAETRNSIHNSWNTFSYYLVKGRLLPTSPVVPEGTYRPVSALRSDKKTPRVIVFIMGESLSYEHMGLFGYPRPTTPRMSLLKNDPKFVYKKGISSAVSTHSALPIFFDLMNEPGNLDVLRNDPVNLFRLAKEAGYKTHWISAQDAKNTYSIGTKFIDDLRTVENDPLMYAKFREDYLVRLFKKLDLSEGRHFVVLHFRTVHSPYSENYEHRGPEFPKYPTEEGGRSRRLVNAYDNAVLYTDDIIADIFETFREKEPADGVFAMTSDHGQLLGQHGLYGHNILKRETVLVPFMLYMDSPDRELYEELKGKKYVTHNEMGRIIAGIMGWRIIDPNRRAGEFFIHGNDIFTDYPLLMGNFDESGDFSLSPVMTLSEYGRVKNFLESKK